MEHHLRKSKNKNEIEPSFGWCGTCDDNAKPESKIIYYQVGIFLFYFFQHRDIVVQEHQVSKKLKGNMLQLYIFVDSTKNYAVVTPTSGWGFCTMDCEGLFIRSKKTGAGGGSIFILCDSKSCRGWIPMRNTILSEKV